MDTEPRPWDRHFLLAAQLCLLSLETPDYHEALAILGEHVIMRQVVQSQSRTRHDQDRFQFGLDVDGVESVDAPGLCQSSLCSIS